MVRWLTCSEEKERESEYMGGSTEVGAARQEDETMERR